MALSPVTLVATISLVALALYKFILQPAFLSPLAKIPNAHPTSAISSLWILWVRWSRRENRTVHAAHLKHGPVVRLGPNELSINSVEGGIRTVYAGSFEKGDWYSNMFTNYGGVLNMFTMSPNKAHSIRKRMMSNIYSKSYLHSSPAAADISKILIHERVLPKLKEAAANPDGIDVYPLVNATTMDFITAYLFGLPSSSNFIQNLEETKNWLDLYQKRGSFNFWPQELPRFTSWMAKFGVRMVPEWVDEANRDIESWTLGMCEAADKVLQKNDEIIEGNKPTVYAKLRAGMEKEYGKTSLQSLEEREIQRYELASEMLDHLAAGFDTSGIALTYLTWELSRNPSVQKRLREELLKLSTPIKFSPVTAMPPSSEVDALPYLNAIVMETLRLHSPIPGGQPRATPAPSCALGEFVNIPAGVRVNAQAYSLHRNASAFPRPEEWLPERWLGSGLTGETEKKERWFWAFGSGGRMCIGSNFAINEIKHVVAAIYSNFSTEIVDDNGIEQTDQYTAPPTKTRLILRFRALEP